MSPTSIEPWYLAPSNGPTSVVKKLFIHGSGYAPIKDIESFAGIKMGSGTLYGALATLEVSGLVDALAPRSWNRHQAGPETAVPDIELAVANRSSHRTLTILNKASASPEIRGLLTRFGW
jgi:hypothetical protein